MSRNLQLVRQVPSSPSDLLCVSPISQFLNGAAGNKRTRQQVLKDLARINIASMSSKEEEEEAMKKLRLDASKEGEEPEQQPKCLPASGKRAILAPRPINIASNSTAAKKKKFVHNHHHVRRKATEETI